MTMFDVFVLKINREEQNKTMTNTKNCIKFNSLTAETVAATLPDAALEIIVIIVFAKGEYIEIFGSPRIVSVRVRKIFMKKAAMVLVETINKLKTAARVRLVIVQSSMVPIEWTLTRLLPLMRGATVTFVTTTKASHAAFLVRTVLRATRTRLSEGKSVMRGRDSACAPMPPDRLQRARERL
jgi:hypothetical protein